MAEQAAADLFGALPEPSGLVKAAVAAAQAAAAAAGIPDMAGAVQDAAASIAAGGPGAHNVTVSGSAVPPQLLLFAGMNGSEGLGNLFSYTVQLKTPDTLNLGYVSPAANLPLKPMVGKDLCVSIELDGGGKRHISGLVTAARVVGHEGRSVTYELRLEPWLKLLTHTSDYKAFQNKTVVDILDEVLDEYSFPVEKRLVENYPPRAWQVQYGETDFDFIQRLMQEWGIYWWFEHSENSHTLVLADAINGHKACPDSPLVEWHQEGLKLDKEFIHTITASERLRTGKWVMDDFDFMKPRSLLKSTVASPRDTGHAEYEHYEWPGDYFTTGEGEMLTRIRMEAQRSPGSRAHGAGHIRTLMTGYTFTLMNHPTAEVNQEYLLVQTTLFLRDNAQHSGQEQHFTYVTTFELHPTSEVYRPQRTLSKPHTKGPQSAIVTGPAGQEIWTDKYGRVKVQFGWDRYLYDAEQPYTPVAAITGRGESRKIWYYHTDLTGTVQEVTAPDGTLVWAGYQAGFGENRGDISNSGAYFEQPLRLPGQYYDEETGLHYNLFRYYAPECGRFVSQDPIGLLGGLNLYAYAPNPLSWIDPLGLTPCANGGNAKKHGGTGHNNFIDNLIADARSQGATNIRKNQWQVDVNGNVVGKNRPDVQFDLNGKHYNIEVDTTIKGSVGHQNTIPTLDPNSRNTFWLIDDLGNILNGHSTI